MVEDDERSRRVDPLSLRFRLRYFSQIQIWTPAIVKLRVSYANEHQRFNCHWCPTWLCSQDPDYLLLFSSCYNLVDTHDLTIAGVQI